MAQQIINYGNVANDGTGDPLRDAFIKVDDNFDQIWAAGPVGSNIVIQDNTISVTNTNGDLILSPNGIGIIQTNRPLYPRLDNTYDLGSANLRYRSAFLGAGGINTSGNLVLGNISNLRIPGGENGYVIQTDGAGNLSWVALPGAGNGSPGGSDTQVQFNNGGLFGGSNTFTFSNATSTLSVGNIVTTTANITSAAGNSWVFNNTRLIAPSGASWESITGVNSEDYIDAAANGYLNFQAEEADTGVYSRLRLLHGEVQITVTNGVAYNWTMSLDGSFAAAGNIDTPGNISGNYILGDGSQLINLPGGVVQANVPPPSPNATTLWWDEITGRLYVWYTDQDGSQWVDAAPAQGGYGNSNVASYLAVGGVTTAISTTGNIYGNYFIGNGSQLTGVTASTGNIGFVGDAIYDINGIYLENADLSHGATAALILPPNTGNIESIQLNNLYGNIILQTGAAGSFTSTWTFDNAGTFSAADVSATGNITAKTFVTTPIPLANLTAVAGARAFVSDGNLAAAGNFGAQIGNAGSNVVPVYSDGVNWYIG